MKTTIIVLIIALLIPLAVIEDKDDVVGCIFLICFFSFLIFIAYATSLRKIKKLLKADGYKLKKFKIIDMMDKRKTVFKITAIDQKGRELTGEATITPYSVPYVKNVHYVWDHKKERVKK